MGIDTRFTCPRDGTPLLAENDTITCKHCGTVYPIIRGVPVLLNEDNSVFRISDYGSEQEYEGASGHGGTVDKTRGVRAIYRSWVQKLANPNIKFKFFTPEDAITHVRSRVASPQILVIGAGETTYPGDGVFYTDVAFGKNVRCICDAHDLPFPERSFDLVIACAVLEHVADPQRCVSEMTRVLGPDGCVYAVTPFLQPVHMGAHDFTRFTYLGHRRLFRFFDDIESGMLGGPGSSLAMVLRYTLLSTTRNKSISSVLRLIGLIVSIPMRYFDLLLVRNPASYDAAFATIFFGSKRGEAISDRDILRSFRGRPP